MKQVIIDYKKGMNMSKIARKYKCSVTPIRRILKINDIRIRQTGEVNTLDLPTDQIFTYYQNGMSISKIARKYKCSKNAIVKRLKDNNVYRYREDIDIPLNEMILEYQNGMNSIQLGTKYNCNQQTIINKLKKVGITIRTKKEVWKDQKLRDKRSMIMTKYWEDITNHEKASAAKQHISYDEWEDFAKEKLYCPDFNEDCKESNRKKYDRRCFLTDLPEENNITNTGRHQRLSVHHVDMDKGQGCNGKRWKLVPLCMEWHSKVHNELWEARIIWLLDNVWCYYK